MAKKYTLLKKSLHSILLTIFFGLTGYLKLVRLLVSKGEELIYFVFSKEPHLRTSHFFVLLN